MDKLGRTGGTFFCVQPDVLALKTEVPGHQELPAEVRPEFQQAANRTGAGIVRAYSSLVIGIKAPRR